jgi:putative multiple sugar transport system ATP-binding protein
MISHKLNEINRVADQSPSFATDERSRRLDRRQITEDRIITSMVGRSLEDRYPPRTRRSAKSLRGEELVGLSPAHADGRSSRTSI